MKNECLRVRAKVSKATRRKSENIFPSRPLQTRRTICKTSERKRKQEKQQQQQNEISFDVKGWWGDDRWRVTIPRDTIMSHSIIGRFRPPYTTTTTAAAARKKRTIQFHPFPMSKIILWAALPGESSQLRYICRHRSTLIVEWDKGTPCGTWQQKICRNRIGRKLFCLFFIWFHFLLVTIVLSPRSPLNKDWNCVQKRQWIFYGSNIHHNFSPPGNHTIGFYLWLKKFCY